MGYEHIKSRYAKPLGNSSSSISNPYLNYHRPCDVAELVTMRRANREECIAMVRHTVGLRQLPDLARCLRAGPTQADLEKLAGAER